MAKQAGFPGIRLPKLKSPGGIRAPRGFGHQTLPLRNRSFRPSSTLPGWWTARFPGGTSLQLTLYQALQRLGMKPGRDFIFRPTGLNADAVLPQRNIALIIQDTPQTTGAQSLRAAQVQNQGLSVVYINSADLQSNPLPAVRSALEKLGSQI